MSIYGKLLKVQKSIGAIEKDSQNPFYKSKYFDINKLLETVKPELNKEGLLLLQPLSNVNGHTSLRTIIIEIETGETEEAEVPLPENSDPQKMGSAITYYRRYALQSLLGLQAEDDDANKASEKQTKSDNLNAIRINIGKIISNLMSLNYFKTRNDVENYIETSIGVKSTKKCHDREDLTRLLQELGGLYETVNDEKNNI